MSHIPLSEEILYLKSIQFLFIFQYPQWSILSFFADESSGCTSAENAYLRDHKFNLPGHFVNKTILIQELYEIIFFISFGMFWFLVDIWIRFDNLILIDNNFLA